MNRVSLLPAASLILFSLALTLPVSVSASTGPVTTTIYSQVGSAHQCQISGLPCVTAIYANAADSTTSLGIVYAVAHNSIGQTVLYTTATLSPAAGSSSTAYLILAGVPGGAYSVQIFAVNEDNVAISTTTTIQVNL